MTRLVETCILNIVIKREDLWDNTGFAKLGLRQTEIGMTGQCEVGVLTVSRYLREGIGSDVRCFVDTKSGLREVEGFTGQPGSIQAVLMDHPRRNLVQLPVPVLLDTEVFLARRDLTGMRHEDVLLIAEQAASANALTLTQVPLDVVTMALEIPNTIVNESEVTVDDVSASPTSQWQG